MLEKKMTAWKKLGIAALAVAAALAVSGLIFLNFGSAAMLAFSIVVTVPILVVMRNYGHEIQQGGARDFARGLARKRLAAMGDQRFDDPEARRRREEYEKVLQR